LASDVFAEGGPRFIGSHDRESKSQNRS
jgi:hypothetical protein